MDTDCSTGHTICDSERRQRRWHNSLHHDEDVEEKRSMILNKETCEMEKGAQTSYKVARAWRAVAGSGRCCCRVATSEADKCKAGRYVHTGYPINKVNDNLERTDSKYIRDRTRTICCKSKLACTRDSRLQTPASWIRLTETRERRDPKKR